ncbi:hypothetical protein [Paenibacillus sp. SYP-B3998]|nr:hypothetical protein [Paenibacillus sp. SYP-B3998]
MENENHKALAIIDSGTPLRIDVSVEPTRRLPDLHDIDENLIP